MNAIVCFSFLNRIIPVLNHSILSFKGFAHVIFLSSSMWCFHNVSSSWCFSVICECIYASVKHFELPCVWIVLCKPNLLKWRHQSGESAIFLVLQACRPKLRPSEVVVVVTGMTFWFKAIFLMVLFLFVVIFFICSFRFLFYFYVLSSQVVYLV